MKILKLHILLFFCAFWVCRVDAQEVRIAFYNTENLADTIANPLTDDSDYTPEGRFRWDTKKYGTKIARTFVKTAKRR